MGMTAILVMWPGPNIPLPDEGIWNLTETGPVASGDKSFQNDDTMDRWPFPKVIEADA